ncbi:MAG: hypothetical protein EA396_07650 [Anaerolineaceae bacterium]|nr:MAG: hypothetical protein EA396_07650 [Anaerolineaceae bacterium]
MSVKLLMSWDIKESRDQDYFEFMVREWLPGVSKLGIQNMWAWYTVYCRDDNAPQIMAEAVAENLQTMQGILSSDDWEKLHGQLLEYVSNYNHKVVRVTGGFQL